MIGASINNYDNKAVLCGDFCPKKCCFLLLKNKTECVIISDN